MGIFFNLMRTKEDEGNLYFATESSLYSSTSLHYFTVKKMEKKMEKMRRRNEKCKTSHFLKSSLKLPLMYNHNHLPMTTTTSQWTTSWRKIVSTINSNYYKITHTFDLSWKIHLYLSFSLK